MNYRTEIDGFRAIAIIPVVLFHAGIESISGGFLGVDIFFVISGYLITSIIYSDIQNNNFSLIDFYERRARRIVPALTIVLLVTTLLSLLLLNGQEVKDYSQSLVSVVTFSSNIYFYLTSGYFSKASEELLLLHTWSLAVEEQFYLFFPLIILCFGKKSVNALMVVIVLLATISFAFTLWLVVKDNSANFYLITSRAWELFAGALVALNYQNLARTAKVSRELLSALGLALILLSLFIITKESKHPGLPTLIPVIGTCLIIAFSHKTRIADLLSNKLFLHIGLVSYSLYLWHQPIFAFFHIKMEGTFDYITAIFAIFITYALTLLSYKFIESPFRNKTKYPKAAIFKYSAFSIILFGILGCVGHFNSGFPERYSTNIDIDTIAISPYRYECHTKGANYMPPSKACVLGEGKSSWAVLGDSHGVEISYGLSKVLHPSKESIIQYTFSECPPALFFETSVAGCSTWLKQTLSIIEANSLIENVLLTFRHTYYNNGDQMYNLRSHIVNGNTQRISIDALKSKEEQNKLRQRYWVSFEALVERLTLAGKKVYILYPIPELSRHINKIVYPFSIFDEFPRNLDRAGELSYYDERNKNVIPNLNVIAKRYGAKAIKPKEILCDNQFCTVIHNNKIIYFDDDHLSVTGAELILNNISKSKLNL